MDRVPGALVQILSVQLQSLVEDKDSNDNEYDEWIAPVRIDLTT